MPDKAANLEKLLTDIRRARVAVIGDFCLDAYWFLDPAASETSLETGLPTRPVNRQRYTLGGAGNVVMNLLALQTARVFVLGVIGDDPFGREILRLLQATGADTAGLLIQPETWNTHVFAKPYIGETEENRVDFGNFNRLKDDLAARLPELLAACLPQADAVIINQQAASGIHDSPLFRERLDALIARHPQKPFLLDSRRFSDAYHGVIRKINAHEALRLCGEHRPAEEIVTRAEVQAAAGKLWQRWQQPLLISRGAHGCLVHTGREIRAIPGLQISGRVDPVGAGDTLLSGVAAALAAGRDLLAAAKLGNFAAAVTVRKLFQTGTASPAEILAIGRDPDYNYQPELAADPRRGGPGDPGLCPAGRHAGVAEDT